MADRAEAYQCLACDGSGRQGRGWVASGTPCLACAGTGHSAMPQHECSLCAGLGTVGSVMFARACPACEGACFVTHRQMPCVACKATGRSGWLGRSQCRACLGTCLVRGKQRRCRLCTGVGTRGGFLGVFAASCPACNGSGLAVGHQYDCRGCRASGYRGREACPVCRGSCLLPYDQLMCSQCTGTGTVKGWLSSSECTGCDRKGYMPARSLMVELDEEGGVDMVSRSVDSLSDLSDSEFYESATPPQHTNRSLPSRDAQVSETNYQGMVKAVVLAVVILALVAVRMFVWADSFRATSY
eukprot:m.429085 g.429085  ORF g.429085 m.429085 type:complete len:299 (-) comp20235_c0_seq19:1657-2553(-)